MTASTVNLLVEAVTVIHLATLVPGTHFLYMRQHRAHSVAMLLHGYLGDIIASSTWPNTFGVLQSGAVLAPEIYDCCLSFREALAWQSHGR